jgi:hypothetical protein
MAPFQFGKCSNDKLTNRDFSNYWTANVYFHARHASYKRVPQIPNRYVYNCEHDERHATDTVRLLFNDKFTTQTSGGFVVYYFSPGKGKVTAFKPVRMNATD